ncbi:MAG: hypothetical protein HOP23_13580 [Methylococcaceae bacterium]|nr:hypothetical protein [Methylococcaceae bacterium]
MSQLQDSWTAIADIKNLLLKRWQQGQLLAETITAGALFPLRIPLKRPSASQLGEHYADVRQWVQSFQEAEKRHDFTVEWLEFNHRQLGRNQLPVAVLFISLEHAAYFIKKTKELELFRELAQALLSQFAGLKDWIIKYPHKVLSHGHVWTRLLRTLDWMVDHPRPQLYLRQISLPGIDSKFIEQHKKLLAEWLNILLKPEDISLQYNGLSSFEQRYGFIAKPTQIRFRILDKNLFLQGLSDLTVTNDEFCQLDLDVDTVFVTENDINGLAFPAFKRAIVIFGRGYGFAYLDQADWLKNKAIWYWGDIDTHGFSILSQFRHYFPQTQSLLMDKKTLLAHQAHWVIENCPVFYDLTHLSSEEAALFDDLRNNRIGKSLRLEQERVAFDALKAVLEKL